MAEKMVLITFKFNLALFEYEQVISPLVSEFVAVAGLRWMIWLVNMAQQEAGGICLFDDEASAQAFLAGSLVAQVRELAGMSELSLRQFDVMKNETCITHGPIGAGVRV